MRGFNQKSGEFFRRKLDHVSRKIKALCATDAVFNPVEQEVR